MCQSDDGLIWVGTLDGIDIFYGGRATRPSADNYFQGEIIERMVETSPCVMWIQTTHMLYKINRASESEEKLESFTEFPGVIAVRRVSDERVALLDADSRLHVYNPDKRCFEELPVPFMEDDEIMDFGGTGECLWIRGKNNVCRYDLTYEDGGKVVLGKRSVLIDEPVKFCSPADNSDTIYVLDAGNRLYGLNISQDTRKYILTLDKEADLRGEPSGIVEINGAYYVSFKVHGVVKCTFDMVANAWVQTSLDIKSGVFQMVRDKYQNLVWVATDGQGLYSVWEGSYNFQSYLLSGFSHDFGKPVRSFFVDEKDWLWIGMKGEGLMGIDRSDSRKDAYSCKNRLFTSSNSALKDNSVYALSASRYGGFWVGTDAGLNFFRYSDRSLRPVTGGDDIIYVHSIHELDDSMIRIATVGAGVFEARIVKKGDDIRLEDVRRYDTDGGKMSSNYFFAMHHASDGGIWLGNRGLGVFRMGAEGLEQSYIPCRNDSYLFRDVFALQEFNGVMWAGTGGGLVGLAPDGDNVYVGKGEGLPNNIVHSLQVDGADGLWIATQNGLARMDSTFSNMESYGRNHGLLVTEFCDGAAFRAKDKLYFGGMNGWVEVSRNRNHGYTEEFIAPIYLFNMKSSQRAIALWDRVYTSLNAGEGERSVPSVYLNPDERDFIIQFTVMDHVAPNDYRYLYRIDSDEEGEWLDNGSLNTISLSKMQHGHYNLHVKYNNLTTGFESAPVSLDIYIAPYWWQTAWMKCLYWIMLAAGAACCIRVISRRVRIRHADNMKELERQHKEELYEEKLRFFTNITHEFCTPLTLIYSPCERILAHEGTDEFVRKYVKLIKKNAGRLNELIQEVIDYRRIETRHQQLHPQRCNISTFMTETCELFADMAEKKEIDFIREIEPDVQWNMDMRILPNIVSNLLSNAVKYTPQGGTVKVGLSRLSGEMLEIKVFNTGKGIREEDRLRIFNRYYVLDNVEEQSAAGLARNGLGMAICYSSVKLLGGDIEINSEVGEYAEFVVRLPLLAVSEEDGQAAVKNVISLSMQNVELKKQKKLQQNLVEMPEADGVVDRNMPGVLVMDDNVDVLFLLKEILSRSYRVDVARSVDETLECLRSSIPQLIVADVMMPGKDGVQLVRQIKQDKHTMHIPIIILSARNTDDDMIEGVQIGADAYIGKPFNVQYLLAMVERMIESRKDIRQYYNSSASAYAYVQGQLLKNEDKDFLYKLEEYVEAHLSDSMLDADSIADAMNMSVRSLYRRLKDMNQPSPNNYIKERRMEKVVRLLKTTDLSIQEIIYECGFNNRAHFYKDFGQRYGMTPKEFRKEQNGVQDADAVS